MHATLRFGLATALLTASLLPVLGAPPAGATSPAVPHSAPQAQSANATSGPTLGLSGPAFVVAGGNGTWTISVSYPLDSDATRNATGNATGPLHTVHLAATLTGPEDSVSVSPATVQLRAGETAFAHAEVRVDARDLPGQASLVVTATDETGATAESSASFLVV